MMKHNNWWETDANRNASMNDSLGWDIDNLLWLDDIWVRYISAVSVSLFPSCPCCLESFQMQMNVENKCLYSSSTSDIK